MGRPKLRASVKKSRHVSFKMTIDQHRRLDELVKLPHAQLMALFGLAPSKKLPPWEPGTTWAPRKATQSSVILWLIHWASLRLRAIRERAAREQAERSARVAAAKEGGHPLRTRDAARMLGIDPERFRDLARQAGVAGLREKHGHLYWTEAKVQRTREYLEKNAG